MIDLWGGYCGIAVAPGGYGRERRYDTYKVANVDRQGDEPCDEWRIAHQWNEACNDFKQKQEADREGE
jgi:hypothetical protein